MDVFPVFKEFVAQRLFEISGGRTELRKTINDILCEVEAVHVVEDGHVERRGDGPFLLVAADVKTVVIGAAIRESMNEPRVSVIGEDDWFVLREEGVEIGIGEAVGML